MLAALCVAPGRLGTCTLIVVDAAHTAEASQVAETSCQLQLELSCV